MELAMETMTKKQIDLYRRFKNGQVILHYDYHMDDEEKSKPNIGCYFKGNPIMTFGFDENSSLNVSKEVLDGVFLMIMANREGKSAKNYKFVDASFEECYDLVKTYCKKDQYFVDLISVKFFFKNKNFYRVNETKNTMNAVFIECKLFLHYLLAHTVMRGEVTRINFFQKATLNGKKITIHNIDIA